MESAKPEPRYAIVVGFRRGHAAFGGYALKDAQEIVGCLAEAISDGAKIVRINHVNPAGQSLPILIATRNIDVVSCVIDMSTERKDHKDEFEELAKRALKAQAEAAERIARDHREGDEWKSGPDEEDDG